MVILNAIMCLSLLGLLGVALWEVLPHMFKSNNELLHIVGMLFIAMSMIIIFVMVSGHVFLSSIEKKPIKKEKVKIETPVDQEKDYSWERYYKLRQ